jgi:hypothetical protein
MFLVEFKEELTAKWLRGDWDKTAVAFLKKGEYLFSKLSKVTMERK